MTSIGGRSPDGLFGCSSISELETSLDGLAKTREVLIRTRNRRVLPLLAGALRSTSEQVRAMAIQAALHRGDRPSQMLLIRHYHELSDAERGLLAGARRAVSHLMAPALQAALSRNDGSLCENACRLIVDCRDYGSAGMLVKTVESVSHPQLAVVAAAILKLARLLEEQIAEWGTSGEHSGEDPSFDRHQMLAAFERHFSQAGVLLRAEVAEAFLVLAPSDHPALLRLLSDAGHHCHSAVRDLLARSESPFVFQLLIGLLCDVDAPQAALTIIANRTDPNFVRALLQSLRRPVPLRVLHNMKRLRAVAWLEESRDALLDFDGRSQAAAVDLAMAADIERASLFDFLVLMVREGLAEGRRAACQALAQFNDPQADMLILAALEDPDPGVQAAAVRQLRRRNIPEALRVLVESLESPAAEVRDAARSSLAEFNYARYRGMFDLLEEHSARTTGVLVHKIDAAAIEGLIDDLTSPSVSIRLRAIEMAVAMGATQQVCEQLVELAKHENAAVRKETLVALGSCQGAAVVEVLEAAAGDANQSIAAAAQQSLARCRGDVVALAEADNQPPGGAL